MPGREWVRATIIKEEAALGQLGKETGVGLNAGREEPKLAVLRYLQGRRISPNPDGPIQSAPARPLGPFQTHRQALPCSCVRDLGTHIPQAEVTHWPVVRLLPVPSGAGWVQCPTVQLPAWGLYRAGLRGQPRLLQRLWGRGLGGQNHTGRAVRVWRQPLVSGPFAGVQGNALRRSKEEEGHLPLRTRPRRTPGQGFPPS